jgi:hypothetical protein
MQKTKPENKNQRKSLSKLATARFTLPNLYLSHSYLNHPIHIPVQDIKQKLRSFRFAVH